MENKKRIDNIASTLGIWCASIGIPLCIIGVGIVIFSGLLGKEQLIGTTMAVSGVALTSFTLPLIVIKLLVSDAKEVQDE